MRRIQDLLTAPAPEAAAVAGLRYVTDASPGIRRRRAGRGFMYIRPDGEIVRDPNELRRIRSLVIPPAWADVWICTRAEGHLQATGRDSKGRKQYRYHPRWREIRDETKYFRLISFGEALPQIRKRVCRDLERAGLPRERVLATVVQLLEKALIRIGNDEYARANGSFGLTTMRNRHVDVEGSTIRFEFRGKGGKKHSVDVNDRRLARIVKRCQDIPGYELFQYESETGGYQGIDSSDVNAYLRELSGQDFTAKDFRTWAGTTSAAMALLELRKCGSATRIKKNIVSAVEQVAEILGNTPAVCRKCYIHPEIIDCYAQGEFHQSIGECTSQRIPGLSEVESAVLEFLRKRAAKKSLPAKKVA